MRALVFSALVVGGCVAAADPVDTLEPDDPAVGVGAAACEEVLLRGDLRGVFTKDGVNVLSVGDRAVSGAEVERGVWVVDEVWQPAFRAGEGPSDVDAVSRHVVAADETFYYLTSSYHGERSLYAGALSGTASRRLTSASQVARDGDEVFVGGIYAKPIRWWDRPHVYRHRPGIERPEIIAQAPEGIADGIAVDATFVYFVTEGDVKRVPRDASPLPPDQPDVPAAPDASETMFAMTGTITHLFVTGDTLYLVEDVAPGARFFAADKAPGGSPRLLAEVAGAVDDVRFDGGQFTYIVDGAAGQVLSVAGGAPETVVATAPGALRGFVLDGPHVVYATGDALRRQPIDGCASAD